VCGCQRHALFPGVEPPTLEDESYACLKVLFESFSVAHALKEVRAHMLSDWPVEDALS